MSAARVLLLVAEASAGVPICADTWRGLSEDDRERSFAIADRAERKRFVVGRRLLRAAYSRLTGGELLPAVLTGAGKPALAGPQRYDFSISHSGEAVAVAIASVGRVGLDLERYCSLDPEDVSVAFSDEELARLRFLPAYKAASACLARWAAKEASAKFLGCPENIDPRRLPSGAGAACRLKNWTLTLANETYHLCLAHEGEPEIVLQKESA